MEKYKICPTCGTMNQPTMIECIKCETDLTGIPIGVASKVIASEYQSDAQITTPKDKDVNIVRICECGTKNSVSARKCEGCGEDISDIIPVQDIDPNNQEPLHFVLESLDGDFTFELNRNLTVVGRENIMREHLNSKIFVSRKHAEFLIEAGKLWVKNHSTTNYTYVNNEKIKDIGFIELHDGDIIGLGGKEINGSMQKEAAYFSVRIGTCI